MLLNTAFLSLSAFMQAYQTQARCSSYSHIYSQRWFRNLVYHSNLHRVTGIFHQLLHIISFKRMEIRKKNTKILVSLPLQTQRLCYSLAHGEKERILAYPTVVPDQGLGTDEVLRRMCCFGVTELQFGHCMIPVRCHFSTAQCSSLLPSDETTLPHMIINLLKWSPFPVTSSGRSLPKPVI